MTPEQFCYWLQGYVEVGNAAPPTGREWVIIRSHLNLVFEKKTPILYPPGGPAVFPPDFFNKYHETAPKITC